MSVRTIAVALELVVQHVDDAPSDTAIIGALTLAANRLQVLVGRVEVHTDPDVLFPTADEAPTRTATPCTSDNGRDCTNPDHDHTGQLEAAANGTGHDTGDDWLVCGDCSMPMHYDRGDEQYHHDATDAPPCFLIPS